MLAACTKTNDTKAEARSGLEDEPLRAGALFVSSSGYGLTTRGQVSRDLSLHISTGLTVAAGRWRRPPLSRSRPLQDDTTSQRSTRRESERWGHVG